MLVSNMLQIQPSLILPQELLDTVIKYVDDYKYILVFEKYLSNFTIQYLLRYTSLYYHTRRENILTLKLIFKYQQTKHKLLCTTSTCIARVLPERCSWSYISRCSLTEKYIREFTHRLDWYYVTTYSILSEEFVVEFKSVLPWLNVCKFQPVTKLLCYEIMITGMHTAFRDNFVKLIAAMNITDYDKLYEKYQCDILASYITDNYRNTFLTITAQEKYDFRKHIKHNYFHTLREYFVKQPIAKKIYRIMQYEYFTTSACKLVVK